MQQQRRFAVGAEPADGGASVRVWAGQHDRVTLVVDGAPSREVPLHAEGDGFFSAVVEGMPVGSRYGFRLGGDTRLLPDPASRSQPDGPEGASELIDSTTFAWTDADWRGPAERGHVVYELHVGTFTPEGTWAAAAQRLGHLAALGVTIVEVMPVAEFAGRFGWGYDGVDLWAPTRLYGRPDDFRAFVDAAHGLGLAVILDVVYNHLGPSGNWLPQFDARYFASAKSEWGDAPNYDQDGCAAMRTLVVENAGYWIDEFHLDGLRLDAVQAIVDGSPRHVVAELTARARAAAGVRRIVVVAENERQEACFLRTPDAGGHGVDAAWNDDFHHAARVALTGRREAYYSGYRGSPQELLSAQLWGYLYQGQRYEWQRQPRGTPALDLEPHRFVTFLMNHDQVANSCDGRRLDAVSSPASWRAMTALLLLGPGTPMLFMGQEFGASARFVFFADHHGELGAAVRAGRAAFLRQFPSCERAGDDDFGDPAAEQSLASCRLDWSELERNANVLQLHRDLLALRRGERALAGARRGSVHGAVLGERALLLRWIGGGADDRLLIVNLGPDETLETNAEPLLAPPAGMAWHRVFASEDARYGGSGAPPFEQVRGQSGRAERVAAAGAAWHLTAQCAELFAPRARSTTEPRGS